MKVILKVIFDFEEGEEGLKQAFSNFSEKEQWLIRVFVLDIFTRTSTKSDFSDNEELLEELADSLVDISDVLAEELEDSIIALNGPNVTYEEFQVFVKSDKFAEFGALLIQALSNKNTEGLRYFLTTG